MSMKDRITAEAAALMSKSLMDQGKLVEAGWSLYCALVVSKEAGPIQISETRKAFFAGAQHIFASIIAGVDADGEPTEADLKRMDLLDAELRKFSDELKLELTPTRGRG